MGLKFLRDDVDSANLVAMYSVDGQPGDWNFFSHDFVNHIEAPKGLAVKVLGAKFATATNLIQYVGLSDFAKYDTKGTEVDEPKFPFSLRF